MSDFTGDDLRAMMARHDVLPSMYAMAEQLLDCLDRAERAEKERDDLSLTVLATLSGAKVCCAQEWSDNPSRHARWAITDLAQMRDKALAALKQLADALTGTAVHVGPPRCWCWHKPEDGDHWDFCVKATAALDAAKEAGK